MLDESRNWYRMTQPLFNSGFEDDEFWAYGQDGFQEVLHSAIGTDVLIYNKTIHTVPQQVRAIIQQKTSDVFNSTTVRQILCNIGILHCGQYVKAEKAVWMISAMPDNNRIYEKAVLWKCKHTIRFLSPITGNVVEYPVYSTNSTQYGTGVSEKTNMDVGDDQHLIYLPYNEETILLDVDFRFIMDKNRTHPTVYSITRVDPVSFAVGDESFEDGLIQWAVQEDQFDEARDSRDFMVADYVKVAPGSTKEEPGTDASLVLTDMDGDFLVAVGEQKRIQVDCVDASGNTVSPFTYRLEYDFSNGEAEVIDDTDGVITLQASSDRLFVGKQIELRVVSDVLGSEATIKLQIVDW